MNKKTYNENDCGWQVPASRPKYDALKVKVISHDLHSGFDCVAKDAAGVAYFIWLVHVSSRAQ